MARTPRTGAGRTPRKRESAQQRSEVLLRDLLPAEAYANAVCSGFLEVESPNYPGRTYRIPRAGFVWVVEGGEPVELLCIGPVEPLPSGDVLVIHKLLIEADEATYLATANHFALGLMGWDTARRLARTVQLPW